jgi:outer membrane lipoprotein-sorting protein
MKKVVSATLAFLLLAASTPASAGESARTPDPVRLLDVAYTGPTASYQGHVLVTQWTGKQTSAEEVNVFFAPPGRYRLEFLAPNGDVDRVVVGDGTREEVDVIQGGKTVSSYATEVAPRFLGRGEERHLLLNNYRVALAGTENLLGRTAWVLDFTPIVAGKPSQRMWIDRDSNVVLEVKRSLHDGGASSQFTRFEMKPVADALFGQNPSLVTQEMGQPIDSAEDAQKMISRAGDPNVLDGGFALLGADRFDVKGQTVRQLRYTDGLVPVSLFVTRVPVAAPKITVDAAQPSGTPMYLGLTTPINVQQWKEGKEHYTLMGELEPSLLQRISVGTQTN